MVNAAILYVSGRVAGGDPPNLFATLARHRGLFRRWLWFAGGLMPGGVLPRADTELVILRVAHNADCAYERRHHEHIARRAGLTEAEIERVGEGPGAPGWSPRQALLLEVADELHRSRTLADSTWQRLSPALEPREIIELCLLVGHYEMLAMTLNALAVEPDRTTIGARRPR